MTIIYKLIELFCSVLNIVHFVSAIKIAMSVFQKRGLFGLYAGVVPSVLRAFVVSSSRFTVYEGTLYLLEKN